MSNIIRLSTIPTDRNIKRANDHAQRLWDRLDSGGLSETQAEDVRLICQSEIEASRTLLRKRYDVFEVEAERRLRQALSECVRDGLHNGKTLQCIANAFRVEAERNLRPLFAPHPDPALFDRLMATLWSTDARLRKATDASQGAA